MENDILCNVFISFLLAIYVPSTGSSAESEEEDNVVVFTNVGL